MLNIIILFTLIYIILNIKFKDASKLETKV